MRLGQCFQGFGEGLVFLLKIKFGKLGGMWLYLFMQRKQPTKGVNKMNDKRFTIVYGHGYIEGNESESETHSVEWFNERNGFQPDDIVKLNELLVAQAMQLDEMHVVSVVRTK